MDGSDLDDMAKQFAALGADLRGQGENDQVLHRLMQLAVTHVPGCAWASVTVVRTGVPRSIVRSDSVAEAADRLQYELGQGPCLQTAEDDHPYLLFDVEREPRWPDYAQALMRRTPVRSVLCFDLAGKERAALNLYGAAAGCYDDEAVQLGAIFAAHASTAVALYEAEKRPKIWK